MGFWKEIEQEHLVREKKQLETDKAWWGEGPKEEFIIPLKDELKKLMESKIILS